MDGTLRAQAPNRRTTAAGARAPRAKRTAHLLAAAVLRLFSRRAAHLAAVSTGWPFLALVPALVPAAAAEAVPPRRRLAAGEAGSPPLPPPGAAGRLSSRARPCSASASLNAASGEPGQASDGCRWIALGPAAAAAAGGGRGRRPRLPWRCRLLWRRSRLVRGAPSDAAAAAAAAATASGPSSPRSFLLCMAAC